MDYRERWELKEYQFEQRLTRRTRLFHGAVVVLLLAYVLAFWNLQVVQGERYLYLAENNRLRRIPLPPTRGAILDRNGALVASTRPSINLVLQREGLEDADGQLMRLSGVLGISHEMLQDGLSRMRKRPTFEPLLIKQDAGLADLARVEARREWFPNVAAVETSVRDYPDGPAVAHAVGYVGEVAESQLLSQGAEGPLEQGDIVGKAGVERSYDESLRGRRGWKLVTVNSLGRPLGEAEPGKAPIDGKGIRVTLDLRLQRKLLEAFGTDAGAGVFMDPWSGEILALASLPTYDPNVFAGGIDRAEWQKLVRDPGRPLHNRAIASFYAPGSTFKVVMSIVGLETGTIHPGTTIHCGGSAVLYGRPFLCWRKGGHGSVDLHQALVHSCNVYFYNVGRTVGIDAIARYSELLNFGRLTGVDLPGEGRGVPPSPEWKKKARNEPWYAGDTISISIGQGLLAVTPIQMATMVSVVATGGRLPRPHLQATDDAPPRRLDLSASTLEFVRNALADVVEEGTGRKANLGPISVAGKTGTAQVFKRSAGIDADKLVKDERDHAWFVGYAPADKPEIAFAVVVEHGGHGGTTAAPIARQVLEVFFADRLPPKRRPGELPEEPAPLRAALGQGGTVGVSPLPR